MSYFFLNCDLKAQCLSVVCGVCPFLVKKKVLLLPFTKVESPIHQSQRDSLGKSLERTLVSDFAILAQKCLKITPRFCCCCSLLLIDDGSKSQSAEASYFALWWS